MARLVTFYEVINFNGESRSKVFFATKSSANAFIMEAMRINPKGDCSITVHTVELDKHNISELINKVLNDE